MNRFKTTLLALLLCAAFGLNGAALAQDGAESFDAQLKKWERRVSEIQDEIADEKIGDQRAEGFKIELKNIKSKAEAESNKAEDELLLQRDLLGTLGEPPEEGSNVVEDPEIVARREALRKEIAGLDSQMKREDLLAERIGNLVATIDKRTITRRTGELMQKSTLPYSGETIRTLGAEMRAYAASFDAWGRTGFLILLLSALYFGMNRALPHINGFLDARAELDNKKISMRTGFHLVTASVLLLSTSGDFMGTVQYPVLRAVLLLAFSIWLLVLLFLLFRKYRFYVPKVEEDEEDGVSPVPALVLNFLLSVLRLSVVVLIPVGLLGYVRLTSWAVIGLFATVVAFALFVALRRGIDVANAYVSGRRGKEQTLPPLAIAIFEPVLAFFCFLFAAWFWGLKPGAVHEWMEQYSEGIPIGSITLDFSDIGAAILVFFVLYGVTKSVQWFLQRRLFTHMRLDRGVRDAIVTTIGYAGITLAVLVAMGTIGIDMSNLAIVAGALSVGIGFGLQTIFNNFVSGLILLYERPIKVGDWIEVGNQQGFVKKVRVRSTELSTLRHASIVIPNSQFISETVTNWTLNNKAGRIDVNVGVAYGSDTELVKEILLKVAQEHPQVRKRIEPSVLFMDFGDSSLVFQLRCFIMDIADRFIVASDLRFAIDREFRANGVEIPFPQRDLHLKSSNIGDLPAKPAAARKKAPAKKKTAKKG